MAVGIAAGELRNLTQEELVTKLRESKEELFNLRFQGATGQLENHGRLRAVRKDIARTLTVMNQEAKNSIRKHYASKGDKMPLDLRSKKTRAMRRRLTPAQAAKKTVKAAKKAANFPKRVYAIRG